MDRAVKDKRLAVVRAHMEAENRRDFDAVIATFDRPRYELMASGDVFDGEDEVRRYFTRSRNVFPRPAQRERRPAQRRRRGDRRVDLLGTHRDTGRSFRSRMVALFLFEAERIVCGRVYFDRASIDEQVRPRPG